MDAHKRGIVLMVPVEGCVQDVIAAGYFDTKSEDTAFDLICGMMRDSDGLRCDFVAICQRDRTNPKQIIETEVHKGECLSRLTFGNEDRQQG